MSLTELLAGASVPPSVAWRPDLPEGGLSEAAARTRWLAALMREPSTHWVRNVKTQFSVLRWGCHWLPVTLNQCEYENSYVCSPFNAFTAYAREELQILPSRALRQVLGWLTYALEGWLKWGEINRNLHINNWLLSTNLYPDLDPDHVAPVTLALTRQFPNHALVFRSLNHATNPSLLAAFEAAGYQLMPSRQVYLFDGRKADYLGKKNCIRDGKLLKQKDYQVIPHEALTPNDINRVEVLYRLLYLDKYSYHNPVFTPVFWQVCHREKILEFVGLRDENGELQGIVGTLVENGVMTTPLVGYNTALPQKHGLYRRLMALVLQDAAQQGVLLNLSAGAASFKTLRGGVPAIEVSAIYARHLPRRRQWVLKTLTAILQRIGVPLMQRYRL